MEPFCLWRIRYTKSSIKLEFPIIERIFSLWLGILNTCSLTCDTNRAHFFCISFFVVPVTSSMNLWLVVDSWVHPWSEVFLCSSGHHPHYKQDRTSSDYPILRSMPRCGVIIKRESDPDNLLKISWYCIRYSSIADSISLWGTDRSIGVARSNHTDAKFSFLACHP